MKFVALLLNLPWTMIALILALISIPYKVEFSKEPRAVIFYIKSFWWFSWLPKARYVRGMAIGNVVMLGPRALPKDKEHELVHVEQFMRIPLIFLAVYEIETLRRGYRENKYEKEAYGKAGNIFISHRWNFGDDKAFSNKMHQLVLSGGKTATTGLYRKDSEIERAGDYGEIVDMRGNRVCVIQYTKVEIKPFLDVTFDYVVLEGENDISIEEWRNKHRDFFLKYYPNFTDADSVVCAEFVKRQ